MQFRSVASSRGALLFLLLFSVQGSLQSDSIGDQRIKQLGARSVNHQRETSRRQDPIRSARATEGDSQGSSIGNTVSGSAEFPKAATDSSKSESIERQGSMRLSRATPAEFSATLDRISAGARLVSAISLINGLVDKSITPNTAITELLSIGGVDVDKLKTFDKQNVATAVQNLVALQSSVASNSVSADLQTMMVLLDSWKQQYEEMGDVKDIEAAKEYFADVQRSQGYDLTKFFSQSTLRVMHKRTQALQSIIQITAKDSNEQVIMDDINDVAEKIYPFSELLADDLSDAIKSLQQFDNLTRRDFIVDSPQRKFMNLLNELGNASRIVGISDPAAHQELKRAATTVHSSLSGPAGDDLFHLGKIASSQLHSGRFASKMYTSGLLNGYVDLGKVDSDVVDPTMESLFGPFNKTVLQQGLEPLKAVAAGAADVYNEWSQLMTPQSVIAAEKLGQVTRWFGALKTPITDETVTKVVQFGAQTPPSIGFSSSFNTLLEKAISVRSVLVTVRQKADVIQKSQSMKDLKLVTEMKTFLPDALVTDVNDMPPLIQKFQNFTGRHKLLTALNDLISKVQDISNDLASLDIVSTLQDLPNGLNLMNEFLGHADFVKVVTYFDGLHGKSKDLKSCSETVQLISQIRKFTSNQTFVQQLDTMSDVVIASLPKVASLLNVTSKIVTEQDEKVLKLARLKDLEKTSKNLGDSVMALHNIQSVISKKTDFDTFFAGNESVEKAIEVEIEPRKTQLKKAWGDIDDAKKRASWMFAVLDQMIASVVPSNVSKFADFAPVFSAFLNLLDVQFEIEKRQKVIEELAVKYPSIVFLVPIVKSLRPVDLHFESVTAPLSRISTTLANVDMHFVAGSAPLSPRVVASSPATVNTATIPGRSALQSGQSTDSSSFPWAIVGCVILVVMVVVVAAGTALFFIRRKKAKTAGKGDVEGKSKSAETEKKSGFLSKLFKKEKPAKNELSKSPAMSPKERADFSPSQSESFGSSIEAK